MGKEYPRTQLEFEYWFRTEAACRTYLIRLRWPGPDGFRCAHCDHSQYWEKAPGILRCGACRKDISVRAGTIFEKSHIPLRVWFRAMWWITNQKSGASALGFQRAIGLGSYETAWACLHKLRRAMIRPGRERLKGSVEVDETYVGGREKGMAGRKVENKAIVVVAVEKDGKGIGRIRLRRIPDVSAASLLPFVTEAVTPGSIVDTDGWSGYNDLASKGYDHKVANIKQSRQLAHELMPQVHRVVALRKRWLLGIHQGRVSKKHLDYYLDEFVFRFNRRRSSHRGVLFYRLAQQAVAIDPVPFSDLIAQS